MPGRRLIVVSEREHSFIDLDDRAEVTIGRAPESDIVLKDDMVSRKHCVLEIEGGGDVRVRDLKSFNGTYLNERRVREEPLHLWDSLRVGRTKMFMVDRLEEASGSGVISSSGGLAKPSLEGQEADAEVEGGSTRTLEFDGGDMASLLQNKDVRRVIDDIVRRQREEVEQEVARRVRDESAPAVLPTLDRLMIRARRFGPVDGGGDFYDVFRRGTEAVCVGLGSVSGVGVAACVAASAARHSLRGLNAGQADDPAEVQVSTLRDVLGATLHPGSAVSLLLARANAGGDVEIGALGGTGVLHYVAATEKVEALRVPGRRDEEAPRPQRIEVALKSDDRLLLVSDGGGALRKLGDQDSYGLERLSESLQACAQQDPKELVATITSGFADFVGEAPDRDATVVVITLK